MSWAQIVQTLSTPITPISTAALPPTHKRCKGCEKVKPVEDFYSRGESNKKASRCKPCYIKHQKELKEKR